MAERCREREQLVTQADVVAVLERSRAGPRELEATED
jgi:hypothetical protein